LEVNSWIISNVLKYFLIIFIACKELFAPFIARETWGPQFNLESKVKPNTFISAFDWIVALKGFIYCLFFLMSQQCTQNMKMLYDETPNLTFSEFSDPNNSCPWQ
jgi:hypothetical protein